VGSARTALFNWLFARQQQGSFVLRIEDTDTERGREEWVDGILSAMSWLGLDPDEGPVRQSERHDRYHDVIEALWASGALYACDCTRDDVLARTKDNPTPGYDGFCRDRGLERGPGRALRFRTPAEGTTVVHDLVRGEVVFPNHAMDDFVAVKSTGQPLFVLANVIDDRDMAISHVIRGEDLLPTTPKGILLWQVLDTVPDAGGPAVAVPLPAFAHLPMLVNEQGKKLSKRRDPVAVEMYRDQGYLPEAFCNYLALLGWSPGGDREKVPVAELVAEFRLEDVHHAPAFFDVKKLTHLNGEYIRELSTEEFIERSRPWVAPEDGAWRPPEDPPWPADRFDPDLYRRLAPLVQERVAVLGEAPAMVDFIFLADPAIEEASWASALENDPGAAEILDRALAAYREVPWQAEDLAEATREVAEAVDRKLGKAQAPIRVAVTGRRVGPPLFESLEALGRHEVLRRLSEARARLGAGEGDAPAG
jgi:glutamyl-tRNA synthetase